MTTVSDLPGNHRGHKNRAIFYAAKDPRMQALLDIAEDIFWPVAYTEDLYIQGQAALKKTPGQVLAVIRAAGAHVLPLAECHEDSSYALATIKINGDDAKYYMIGVTGFAKELTAEQAAKAVVK